MKDIQAFLEAPELEVGKELYGKYYQKNLPTASNHKRLLQKLIYHLSKISPLKKEISQTEILDQKKKDLEKKEHDLEIKDDELSEKEYELDLKEDKLEQWEEEIEVKVENLNKGEVDEVLLQKHLDEWRRYKSEYVNVRQVLFDESDENKENRAAACKRIIEIQRNILPELSKKLDAIKAGEKIEEEKETIEDLEGRIRTAKQYISRNKNIASKAKKVEQRRKLIEELENKIEELQKE